MLDDGVKAAGVDEDQVKVADIAMHLLDAIEDGERSVSSACRHRCSVGDRSSRPGRDGERQRKFSK